MPSIRITVLLAILLLSFQTDVSWAASMSLVYGPGGTSIVVDPGCEVRGERIEDPRYYPLTRTWTDAPTRMWIDCQIEGKQITLMILASPDVRLSEDYYYYKNAGAAFALITARTDWAQYRDMLDFQGAQSSNHFFPIAWLKTMAWFCPSTATCSFPPEKIFELKLLGTASHTVALLAFGDTVESEITIGQSKATKAYFPDPVAAMIGSFHFENLSEK